MLSWVNLYKKLSSFTSRHILPTLASLLPLLSFAQRDFVETLYFKPNSYKLDKSHTQVIDQIGQKCSSDSFGSLKIFGYADTKGSRNANELLSKRRAQEVYDYLIKRFPFDTTKVYVTWLGEETDQAYDLHFPEAHLQQRCVDIILTIKKPSN